MTSDSQSQQHQQKSDGGSSISSQPSSDVLSLEFAMKAADKIRKTLIHKNDVTEKSHIVPPGTIQGVLASLAAGLLLTPIRSSILRSSFVRTPLQNVVVSSSSSNPPPATGPFQGFIDLIITPAMVVVAAQVGLVVGTLYGSNFYLNRVAKYDSIQSSFSSRTTTTTTLNNDQENNNNNSALSSSTDGVMNTICQELLDMSPSPSSNNDTTFSTLQDESKEYIIDKKYESWDPRANVMESLLNAIQNCRKKQQNNNQSDFKTRAG
jgi:hypothetical protein